MKLICELTQDITITEAVSDSGKKELFIEGVFAQAEVTNRNGRRYPISILEREINKYNQEFVKTGRAIGELNHPDSPQINPDRVSHLITELRKDGNDFIGKAKILNTDTGRNVKGLLEGGVKLGVSTRGLGTLKANKDGINEVQKDFQLSTVDIVTNPSAPDSFVNGIMESVDFFYENGMLCHKDAKAIKDAKVTELDECKIQAFIKILSSLTKI